MLLGAVLAQGTASAAYAADGLPTGGHFTAGTGSIAGDGSALAVSQSSNTGIIDWNSFSIGSGRSVAIDNGSGATLNRVTGSDLSRIDGLFSATGSAYLINRNGIVVGPGGQVITGGSFVGSTRDISNEDFLTGGAGRFSGTSSGDVVNQGTIRAEGGDAVLIGRSVSNSGSIDAPSGTAAMAAGNDVILQPVGGDRRIYIQGSAGDGNVTNDGAVAAAQAELAAAGGNVYALAGNTDGVIRATGSATKDGRILLTAGGDISVAGKLAATDADGSGGAVSVRGANIDMSGDVDASAAKPGQNGGDVSVIATGTTDFSGSIKAEGGAGAKGGEVETSGEHLNVADSARVSTLAEGGQSGTWLLDPNDFTIATSGGDITGATLSTNLAGGNVAISSNDGATSGNGDIFVNDAVTWSANTTLTLNAVRNIEINDGIAASGAGAGLVLTYGGGYSFADGGTVTLSGAGAGLSMGGNTYTLVHNANDLQAITGSGYYALADNIDASGTASWDSGAGFAPINGFSGVLAGLNHAIDGLTIDRSSDAAVGMFASTSGGFRDFTLSNVSIVSGGSVGALAYRLDGGSGVSNVHVTGNVTSLGGGGQVGGLVGWVDQSSISDSSSTATVTGFGEVGGLVGRLRAGSITNSYATGVVTGTTDYVGGLVGGTYQGGTLTNVYASGNVTGTTNVGGLVGGASFAGGVTANNAYWDVDSTGQSTSFAGTGINNADAFPATTYSGFDFTDTWVMLAGETRPMLRNEYATTIFTPHALQLMSQDLGADYKLGTNLDMTSGFTASGGTYGDVWGTAGFVPVGTFLGSFDGQSHTITDLTINRGSTDQVGLFSLLSGTVSDVGLIGGSITGGGESGTLVGVVNASGSVTRAYSTAAISANGNFAGGLIGHNFGTVSLSCAGGPVTSTASSAGGLVGVNDGTISDSYATGAVSATTYAGGFAGGNRGTLEHVYSTGLVSGGGSNGGLTPYNVGTITESYWDTQTSGTTSGYGTALTTAQLQGTFPTGFSSAVWGTGANLYPYFNWQYATTPVAVSGKAYSDSGTTAFAGANVSALSDGRLLGSATTGANGYYYILAAPGSIDAAGALAYLDGESTKAGAFSDKVAAAGISNLDIYGTSLDLIASSSTLGGTLTNLNTTLAGYSDTDVDFFNPSSTKVTYDGYDLYLHADQAYAIDGNLTSGGALSLGGSGTYSVSGDRTLKADGDLTIASAFAWSDASALTLQTINAGDIQLDAGISASSGSLTLDGSGSIATGASTAVDVALFDLASGAWNQVGASLPSFSAKDFRLSSGSTFVRALGGNGVAGTPYQIADVYGLQGMASQSLLGKSFVLASDIDASGTSGWNSGAGFDPIGDDSNPFTGGFDGQNHTITGLTIDRATTDYVGLFGYTGSNVTLKDVVLDGIDITGQKYVGGVIGSFTGNTSLLTNVSTSGQVGGEAYVGGLVGNNASGTISYSAADVDVTATGSDIYNNGSLYAMAGGVAGANTGTILQSHASGTVSGSGNNTGGFVGINSGASATIVDSYATGKVEVLSGGSVGGLAGVNVGTVTRSYATGDVSGVSNVGGLVGINANGAAITTAFATGAVSGSANLGGLVGLNTQAVISTTYATGSVTGGSGVGGLIGNNYLGNTYGNTVANSYATGAVHGSSAVAGLIGSNYLLPNASGSVTASFWNTETTGQSNGVTGTAVAGAIGVDTAGLKTLSTFTDVGWNIDGQGGTSSIWRIYEGQTAPLIRYFMTGLTVTGGAGTKTYDGSAVSADVGTLAYNPSGYDSSLVLGTAQYTASSANAGSYSGSDLSLDGLYSSQLGYDISFVSGSLTVGKASLEVTAKNDSKTYDGNAYSGGNGVSYAGFVNGEGASVLSGTVGYGGTSQGAVNAGSYTITASGLTSNNYDISYVAGALTVGKASLGVTADAVSKTYGDALSLTAFSTTGLVGSDSISGVTLTSAGTAATANVGSYDISSSNAVFGTGSAANYDIHYNTRTGGLTVNKASLTVTAKNDSKTYDGNAYSGGNGVSYAGFVNGDGASALSGTVGYGGTSQGAVNAGSYTITASGLTSGNYDISYVAGALTVGKASLEVTARNDSKTYDGNAYSGGNGVTYAGFVNGEGASVLSGTVGYGGTSQGAVNAGTYAITASGLSSGNYDISYVAGTLTIGVATVNLTITPDAATKTYGDALSLTGFSTSGLVGSDSISSVTLTSAGTAATANAGSYDISSSNAVFGTGSASNYDIHYNTLTDGLTVKARPITVTADNLARLYGASNPGLTWQMTSGNLVNGDKASGGLTTLAAASSDVGTYGITQGTFGFGSNYALTFVPGTLTVNPATLTVTADTQSRIYGDSNPALTYGYSGFVNGDGAGLFSGALTTTADVTSNVGSYAIAKGTLSAGSNYLIDFTSASLAVTARPITVTADNLARVYGASNPVLGWQVTSGSLANGDTPSGALATSATASSNVGAYGIAQGTFGLGSNYALTFVAGTLTVNPATLTITADDEEKNTGQSIVLSGYRVNGLVSGDTVTGVMLASSGTDANALVGSYAIVVSNATGSGLSNYDIHYVDGTLTVRDRGPGQSIRSIESRPGATTWNLSESEVGPGAGVGGFWSLPLIVRTSLPVLADTADIMTASIQDGDGDDAVDDRWNLLLGTPGRLNGRTTIGVRYPHLYLNAGILSVNSHRE
ncbi:MBG domain-containing protein [uncultured Parvibaculum sp.]|uniref:MBG domain-containing protein n=1 Tax=uncultured Parvibaculum sp. TaxID=291828 RepID=UPI0030D9DF76